MNSTTLQKKIFDTSALKRFLSDEKGSDEMAKMLEDGLKKNENLLVSTLSVYELALIMGRRNVEEAVVAISFIEKICRFISPNTEISQNAALLKIKHPKADISMADAIILQTGIKERAEIITADKEWKKIVEADVKII
ncbi:MAG: PIN domain-containing protein [Candidatus Diapherotrites archaeon]